MTITFLDRTQNGNVIRKYNTMIICHQFNRTKGERTLSEFVEYCKMVVKKYGD